MSSKPDLPSVYTLGAELQDARGLYDDPFTQHPGWQMLRAQHAALKRVLAYAPHSATCAGQKVLPGMVDSMKCNCGIARARAVLKTGEAAGLGEEEGG